MTPAEVAAALQKADELQTVGNAMWVEKRGQLRPFDGFQVHALATVATGGLPARREVQFAAVVFGGALLYGPAAKILDGFADYLRVASRDKLPA